MATFWGERKPLVTITSVAVDENHKIQMSDCDSTKNRLHITANIKSADAGILNARIWLEADRNFIRQKERDGYIKLEKQRSHPNFGGVPYSSVFYKIKILIFYKENNSLCRSV